MVFRCRVWQAQHCNLFLDMLWAFLNRSLYYSLIVSSILPFPSDVLVFPWTFLLCSLHLYSIFLALFLFLTCALETYLPASYTPSLIPLPSALLATSTDTTGSASVWNTKGRTHHVHCWCQNILRWCRLFSHFSCAPFLWAWELVLLVFIFSCCNL